MSNTLSNNVLVMIVDDQLNSDDKNAGRKKSYKAFITKMNEQFAGKWILDHRFCATPNELASIPSGRDRSRSESSRRAVSVATKISFLVLGDPVL